MITRSDAAAILHLLLVGAAGAGAQMMFLPNCNFQEVNLAPCTASTTAAAGNISGACCSSLNRALDAGHRCVCSLLLSNAVFASLVTNLLTLPLVLPLPGCFLYAPSLAACPAAMLQQTNAPPASASAVASTEAAAGAVDPPAAHAAVMPPLPPPPPEKKSSGAGNGTSEAPRDGQTVSRSNACRRRHPGIAGEGTAYTLTVAAAIAVFWLNRIADS